MCLVFSLRLRCRLLRWKIVVTKGAIIRSRGINSLPPNHSCEALSGQRRHTRGILVISPPTVLDSTGLAVPLTNDLPIRVEIPLAETDSSGFGLSEQKVLCSLSFASLTLLCFFSSKISSFSHISLEFLPSENPKIGYFNACSCICMQFRGLIDSIAANFPFGMR